MTTTTHPITGPRSAYGHEVNIGIDAARALVGADFDRLQDERIAEEMAAARARRARDVRGTPEWVATYQHRLAGVARRAQIGLELDVEPDLAAVATDGEQLDLFA